MLQTLSKDRKLVMLVLLSVLIKMFSLNERVVERYYTYGFYPIFSKVLRELFGWIPFSSGDILYVLAGLFIVWKCWKVLSLLARRKVKEYLSWILFRKYLRLVLCIYIIFNLFWGLNYNRLGIASQLGLNVKPYSKAELFTITNLIQQRLNLYAAQVDTVKRLQFEKMPILSLQGIANYKKIETAYPFLTYSPSSIKSSLFSHIGHYFGFGGYFNPFTGEAQVNVAEPVFLKPFVINHEMAHQVGYAKENEASFVSYLACKTSDNIDFRYSVYYELFTAALFECRMTGDTAFIGGVRRTLSARVKLDRLAELQYRFRKRNRMSPYVTDFYDQYLKMNNQPKGMETYNEVVAWLIAYVEKNGVGAI